MEAAGLKPRPQIREFGSYIGHRCEQPLLVIGAEANLMRRSRAS
jgi:hypothetical protein